MIGRRGLAPAAGAFGVCALAWVVLGGDPGERPASPESREARPAEARGVEAGRTMRAARSRVANDAIAASSPARLGEAAEEERAERLGVIEADWRAAADGRDEESSSLARLVEATRDPDPAVAALAERAVEDVLALELARQGLLEPGPRPLEDVIAEALGSESDELRAAAIGELSVREEPETLGALLEAARADPSPDIRQQALESLWRSIADGRDVDGSVRKGLEAALGDDDPQTAALAERALADLAELPPRVPVDRASDDRVDPSGVGSSAVAPPAPIDSAAVSSGGELAAPGEAAAEPGGVLPETGSRPPLPVEIRIEGDTRSWEEVADRAISEPEPEQRERAIDALSLSLDSYADGPDVLRDIARYDRDAANRQRAIETLWRAAADGRDTEGLIRLQLEESASDEDPRVAELARRALEDLEPEPTESGS